MVCRAAGRGRQRLRLGGIWPDHPRCVYEKEICGRDLFRDSKRCDIQFQMVFVQWEHIA
jgi:hypothetical protein